MYCAKLGAALAALALGAACAREEPRGAPRDTAAAGVAMDTARGVVDSAPASALTGVAALLSDENIFAQLDTAYGLLIATEQLAPDRGASPQVKEFAAAALNRHLGLRRSAVAMADRYNISRILPKTQVLEKDREILTELRGKTGAAFDTAFVERTVEIHKDLLKHLDNSLEATRQPAVTKFLQELRTNIQADLKRAEALGGKAPKAG